MRVVEEPATHGNDMMSRDGTKHGLKLCASQCTKVPDHSFLIVFYCTLEFQFSGLRLFKIMHFNNILLTYHDWF